MKTSRIASLRPSAAASLLIAFSAATTLAAAGDAPLVTFSVGSHWEGGYGGSVTIRNRGESAMSSWSVEYGGGPEVGSLWNGVHALIGGGRSRISNASWNGSLAPGASVSVGFNGVGTMTNDVADCTVNGASAEVAYQLPDGWASGGSGGGGEAGGGGEGGGESGGGSSGGGGANLEPPIVRFTIGNVWSGGYGATISIENAGGAAIENWQLEFIGGPNVASLWNGTHSVANGVQTVVAPSWNPNIAGGASVSLGLTGNGTMTDDVSMCRVNGVDATIVYELPEGWAGGSAGGGEGGGESGGGAGGGSGGGESGGGEAGGGTGGGESGGGAGGGESGGGESGSGAGGGESGGGEAGGGSGGGESGGGESGGGANIEPPRVRFTVGNTWGGGYGATISIENAGSVAIENWSLTYRGGPDVASLWNGTYSQSGDLSTIGHSGWNAAIGAGSAVSVGFTGLGTMTDNVVECRVNGVEATVVYELPAGWSGGGSSGGGDGGGESGGSTGGSGGGESGGEGGGGSGGGESGGGSSGGIDPDGQYGGGGETGSSGESGPRFSCEGDLNRDFVVDDADLVLLAASLGESGEGLAADLDRNGLVDETDLAMLEALFGACPEKRIVAYFAEWGIYGRQYFPASMPLHKVTHINYAFANIGADGRVALGDSYAAIDKAYPGDNWEQPVRGNYNQFNNVLKTQYPHLKTLISVGGWTWSARFSDVALTPQSRAVFAESCVDFIRQYGFDGVDLDWEYPVSGGLASNVYRPQDGTNYTLLVAEIRAQLDAAGAEDGTHYLLTIASAAGFDKIVNFDLAGMHPYLDFINVMSYDLFGAWDLSSTGHQAGLRASPGMTAVSPELRTKYNVESAIEQHLAAGVPASKIVPGVAFYGRSWGGVPATNDGLFQPATSVPAGQWDDWSSGATGVYDWTNLEDKIASGSYTRHWDSQAKAPWLYGNAFGGHFISYDDPASVMLKGSFVMERGLGGLMFWEASGDRRETLFDAVLESLEGVPGGSTP